MNEEHDKIGQLIKQSYDVLPPGEEFVSALAARARQELASVFPQGSQVDKRRTQDGSHEAAAGRSMTLLPLAWWGVAATVAATVALACIIGWLLRPRVSLADVAAAVLDRPWIHVSDTRSDGTTRDLWCSPTRDVSAVRSEDRIEYRDHRLRVYYWYDPKEEVLYRVPEYAPLRAYDVAPMVTALRVLLQSGQPADKPLERLGFLRQDESDLKVLQQKLEKVESGGRKWLDYHLTVQSRELPEPFEMLFRVDRETKLLKLCRGEGRQDGKRLARESHFDYPQKGPADVYELGVPRTAKLVDRTPSNDLTRILETLRAGRQRMDDYRAFLIQRADDGDPTWWSGIEILYRKGDKFRRDFATWKTPEISKRATEERWPNPTRGEAPAVWWGRHMEYLSAQPTCIVHGSAYYYDVTCRPIKYPDGSQHIEIDSVEKCPGSGGPSDLLPVHWSLLPEFICRPPLGIPSQWAEPVLELNPKEGPSGSILLRVRLTGRMTASPSPAGVPQPDRYRFWLDPARDYVVVRCDMLRGGDGGKEELIDSNVIEELARSPQGTWYATRVRRKAAIRSEGKTYDQLSYFYVDFSAELPDALFDVPKPGRIQ